MVGVRSDLTPSPPSPVRPRPVFSALPVLRESVNMKSFMGDFFHNCDRMLVDLSTRAKKCSWGFQFCHYSRQSGVSSVLMNHHLLRNWAGFCGVNLTCSSTIVVMIIHQLETKKWNMEMSVKMPFCDVSRETRSGLWGDRRGNNVRNPYLETGPGFCGVKHPLNRCWNDFSPARREKKYKPQSCQSKCPFCDVSCETRSGLWGSCQQCEEFIRKNIIYLLQEKRNEANSYLTIL